MTVWYVCVYTVYVCVYRKVIKTYTSVFIKSTLFFMVFYYMNIPYLSLLGDLIIVWLFLVIYC